MSDKEYNLDLDNVTRDVDVETFDLYGDDKDENTDTKNNQDSNDKNVKTSTSSKLIDKAMMIEEIVMNHPEIVPMLLDYGVHCVGCGGASFETLEEGFMGHGMSGEEVDKVVEELNEYIKSHSSKEQ